jgi:endoglucanase
VDPPPQAGDVADDADAAVASAQGVEDVEDLVEGLVVETAEALVDEVRLTCSTVVRGSSSIRTPMRRGGQPGNRPAAAGSVVRAWHTGVRTEVDAYVTAAAAIGRLPFLTAHNRFSRDSGGQSSGGAASPDAYRAWIDAFAAGIADRPAIVIVEPDSLAQLGSLPAETARAERTSLAAHAAEALAACPLVSAYLDGGNAAWVKPDVIAERLSAAQVAKVRGFVMAERLARFPAAAATCPPP